MASFALLEGNSIHRLPYRILSLICQTLFYGIYLCLISVSVHIMVTNGLQTRSRKWLFAMTTSMFALSTGYWILSVIVALLALDTRSAVARHFAIWLPMFSAILLVNYIVADSVIVWRAWILCSDQSRVVLMFPVVMLAINTLVYLLTIALRAKLFMTEGHRIHHIALQNVIATSVIVYLVLSLSTNIFATSIIALKTWKYRKSLMASGMSFRTPTQAIMILVLLVESGVLYIVIGVAALASVVIPNGLPFGALSDIFMPVNVQLTGMYPIVVVLLVEKKRSINSTYSPFGAFIDVRGGQPTQTEPMCFVHGPVSASGGQIDLATRSPNSIIRVTLGSLESGDTGISEGSSWVSSEGHD